MFESHVTVEDFSEEGFRAKCKDIGVKPVVIYQDSGGRPVQMMTQEFFKSTDRDAAVARLHEIADQFGTNCKRRKLEEIVGGRAKSLPPHDYLEFHLKYSPVAPLTFSAHVLQLGGKTSMNANGNCYATANDRATYEKLKSGLIGHNFISEAFECIVFDSNPSYDFVHHCDCGLKVVPIYE
jgi:hypothetical protein